MKHISKVNILAAQIRQNANGTTRSQSMKQAWAIVLSTPTAQLITFKNKSGEVTRRVVAQNWFDFYTPVGGRSTNKPDQILFADLAKWATGTPCIISTFSQNILALA